MLDFCVGMLVYLLLDYDLFSFGLDWRILVLRVRCLRVIDWLLCSAMFDVWWLILLGFNLLRNFCLLIVLLLLFGCLTEFGIWLIVWVWWLFGFMVYAGVLGVGIRRKFSFLGFCVCGFWFVLDLEFANLEYLVLLEFGCLSVWGSLCILFCGGLVLGYFVVFRVVLLYFAVLRILSFTVLC